MTKRLLIIYALFAFIVKVNSQIAPNKAFDTLTESIKATSYERGSNAFLSADHHYCLMNNHEFQIINGNSFWPFRFEDEINKKLSLQLDHIKFARKGYLPVLFKVKRPAYNKRINVYLEKLKIDSLYEMENIFFRSDMSIDEKASSNALYMYKNYLIGNQLKMKIEITDICSLNVLTIDDKKKAANNLKALLGCSYCVSINIQAHKKGTHNTVVFKVLKL